MVENYVQIPPCLMTSVSRIQSLLDADVVVIILNPLVSVSKSVIAIEPNYYEPPTNVT